MTFALAPLLPHLGVCAVLWWILLGFLGFLLVTAGVLWFGLYFYIYFTLIDPLVRNFQEKPLFIIPRGQPISDAEDLTFKASDGRTLRGLYLKTTAPQRRGVILFGLEYGSTRWASIPYTSFLREAGFDIFTFEPRSQGESEKLPSYEPLQWVTSFEVEDFQSAIAYLKGRPDADRRGVGFFGISKGGGAGLLAAANEPYLRCFVTDGIFGTYTTLIPYMRKWVRIYSDRFKIASLVPDWYYGMFARIGLKRIERERQVTFPHLEEVMPRLAPRPLLMIHGAADTYIRPEMAQQLFQRAGEPKELWLVEGAKHNQALHVANGEYQRRILAFFQTHLELGDAGSADSIPASVTTRQEVVMTPHR